MGLKGWQHSLVLAMGNADEHHRVLGRVQAVVPGDTEGRDGLRCALQSDDIIPSADSVLDVTQTERAQRGKDSTW